MTALEPTAAHANVALIRTGFADFNAGDLDACASRLTPDIVINLAELPEPMHGPDVWRQGAELIKRAFPRHTLMRQIS